MSDFYKTYDERVAFLEAQVRALKLDVVDRDQKIMMLKREVARLRDLAGTTPQESAKLRTLSKLALNWAGE